MTTPHAHASLRLPPQVPPLTKGGLGGVAQGDAVQSDALRNGITPPNPPLVRAGTRRAIAALVVFFGVSGSAFAAQAPVDADASRAAVPEDGSPRAAAPSIDVRELFRAGGAIGIVILALSVAMLALIVEHLISIRRGALMPPGLAEHCHQLIAQRQFKEAEQLCQQRPSFLGHVLAAGLREVELGYEAVEKSMEDAATEQSARLFRKIEYLSVIGTIAPMLGLLGTVWGMILAFMEFEAKANPQVAELAPGIYKALVTTLVGLCVAVPALASFAVFRNRIDELVAESSLLAEHVFVDYKRSLLMRKKQRAAERRGSPALRTGPEA
ncbi:MAG: MotA/TolQ/ExbB proton channel family protein [Planctomycetes bacterium]|nr:MotA/TolQ/ExbB proton channel family protein [Planctomycetota bacterium]